MKPFLDNNFLLESKTAEILYHEHAAKMPIIDYHCHVSPREIAEDMRFANITQAWLGGDHYKWRLIRANGVEERFITGEAGDYEKFERFAAALPRAIGNPLYHWTHLELRRYFDCDLPLSPATAKTIWEHCNKRLADADMSVRGIIQKSNVTHICTTDDPIDSLEWHKVMAADKQFAVTVAPAFRPDKAINIEKPGFCEYIAALSAAAGLPIKTLEDLKAALTSRIDFFATMGCVAADHGVDYVPWAESETAAAVFEKKLSGNTCTAAEMDAYKTAIMLFLGREYAKRNWVMQIHYGVARNTNTAMMRRIGPDTGFDCISQRECSAAILHLLDALAQENLLPRTVLYSLNPADNAFLASAIGAFQGAELPGKIQHGSAWWFSDTKPGMIAQMTNLANLGILGNFIGMLTDSRSFLSYTRHEYFRRIFCNLLGGWVENGEYPADMTTLGGLVEDISYRNAMRYLGYGK